MERAISNELFFHCCGKVTELLEEKTPKISTVFLSTVWGLGCSHYHACQRTDSNMVTIAKPQASRQQYEVNFVQ
jgi:hypothetical protein